MTLPKPTIDDLNYANVTYENSRAYLHVGTQPVVFFFGDPAYELTGPAYGMESPATLCLYSAMPGASPMLKAAADIPGWLLKPRASSDPMALLYMDYYYRTRPSYSSIFSMGSAYKGFDDSLAAWGTGR